MIGGARLLQPVEAVTVSLAIDEVELAVMVYVVAEDGEAGISDIPVAVPRPLVVVGIDLLEPPVRREHIGLAIAVDVGDADAVTVLLAPTEMMDTRLVLAEIDPQDTVAVVVCESEVGLAVAIDVREGTALRVIAVGNLFGLPCRAPRGGLCSGIAIPPEAI